MDGRTKIELRIDERAARIIPGQDARYRHWFGGPPEHQGASFRKAPVPLHLLYSLDLRDPKVGIRWTGLSRLPLYYGFPFSGEACCYQVQSEDRVVVLNKPGRYDHEFPRADYPREFPRVAVRLEAISYEDRKLIAFCNDLGIFSYSDARRGEISRADRKRLAHLEYPFAQIGSPLPLQQGVPYHGCPAPECRRQDFPPPMRTFATVWNRPVPGVCLWGDNHYVQVVFEICTRCGTISATTQCD